MPVTAKPKLYNPRHPERTLLYQTVAEHYETWLDLASAGQYDGQRDGPVLNMVPRIFLRVIAQNLQAHCRGAVDADKANLHIGAVAFIHRFGSSLNEHVHFHVCVVDGVFEAVVGEGALAAPGVNFHPASGINADTVAPVQTTLQRRILRAFVGRGLLENCDLKGKQTGVPLCQTVQRACQRQARCQGR